MRARRWFWRARVRAKGARLVGPFAPLAVLSCAEPPSPSGSGSPPYAFAEVRPTPGVPDRGADPAVVALAGAGPAACAGTLVAPDVVLTERSCAAGPGAPSSLRVLVGDTLASAVERARASEVLSFTPAGAAGEGCEPGLAVVFLDTPIDDVRPLAVRSTGAARGDRLRTVGYTVAAGGDGVVKSARDHLPVLEVTEAALHIGEACFAAPGGPAIEEATGEVVGVGSCPGAASCPGEGAFDVYLRADAAYAFVAGALSRSALRAAAGSAAKATVRGPLDMGATCLRAEDCAAGVCVRDSVHDREYCSRTCDDVDRCPARYLCRKSSHVDSSGVETVCVEH